MRVTQTRGKASKQRRRDYAWARAQTFASMTTTERILVAAYNKATYNDSHSYPLPKKEGV